MGLNPLKHLPLVLGLYPDVLKIPLDPTHEHLHFELTLIFPWNVLDLSCRLFFFGEQAVQRELFFISSIYWGVLGGVGMGMGLTMGRNI